MIRFLEKLIYFFTAVMMLAGCAAYHPMPLTQEAVNKKLVPPDLKNIRILAESIKHPVLKPVLFDYRDGLSPDEAAVFAVIANPMLRGVRDRSGIASAQLLKAGILPNPQLSFSLATPVGGNTQSLVNDVGFGLNWDVTSLLSRNARMNAAKKYIDAIDLEVAWQEWQVAEAAKLHVYRILIDQKRLAVARRMEIACLKTYKTIEHGVELGVKTAFDLSGPLSSLQNAKSIVLMARTEAEKDRIALNKVLGLPTEKSVVLEKGLNIQLLQVVPNQKAMIKDMEKRRIDLLALKAGYESREAKVRAAVMSQFPKISLGLSFARGTDSLKTAGGGIMIELPLFNLNQGNIALEQANRKHLFDEYTERVFEARNDISRICKEVHFSQKHLKRIDHALSTLKKMETFYFKACQKGYIDVLDYYASLNLLYAKQLERIKTEGKLADLKISLEIASGSYASVNKSSRQILPGHRDKQEAPQ